MIRYDGDNYWWLSGRIRIPGRGDEEVDASRAINEKIRWYSSSGARRSAFVRSSLVITGTVSGHEGGVI